MKIYVNRIPAEGLKEHATYDPATLDLGRFDVHLTDPFAVDVVVTKADQEVVVNAEIRCPLHLSCARCLEEFASVFTTDAIFSYKAGPTDVIDISDDVRQEIILGYPMIPVCRATCKGLCSACGQNLNVAPCSHHQPGVSSTRKAQP